MTGQNGVGIRALKAALLLAVPIAMLSSLEAAARMPMAQIGANKVKLEVASTPAQITRGLMYRQALPEDNGMVFIFHPVDSVKFWMAHCFISLDMLFIKDGKIVKIFENVPPCHATDETQCPTYPSATEPAVTVTEVLEVNGGYAKRHGIKEGDVVKFSLNGFKSEGKTSVNQRNPGAASAGAGGADKSKGGL